MGPNRSQCAGVFARQRDKKPSSSDVRGDKSFDGIDCCAVDIPFEIQRPGRRDSTPFSKRLASELLVVEFNLARGFQNRGRAMV